MRTTDDVEYFTADSLPRRMSAARKLLFEDRVLIVDYEDWQIRSFSIQSIFPSGPLFRPTRPVVAHFSMFGVLYLAL